MLAQIPLEAVSKSCLALKHPPWERLPAAIGPEIEYQSRLEAAPTGIFETASNQYPLCKLTKQFLRTNYGEQALPDNLLEAGLPDQEQTGGNLLCKPSPLFAALHM